MFGSCVDVLESTLLRDLARRQVHVLRACPELDDCTAKPSSHATSNKLLQGDIALTGSQDDTCTTHHRS